jgi:hypothetical protein
VVPLITTTTPLSQPIKTPHVTQQNPLKYEVTQEPVDLKALTPINGENTREYYLLLNQTIPILIYFV